MSRSSRVAKTTEDRKDPVNTNVNPFLTSSKFTRADVKSTVLTENQEADIFLHNRKLKTTYRPLTSPSCSNKRERLKLALSARAQERDKTSRKYGHLQSASANHLQAGTTSIMLKRSQTVTHRPLTTPSSSHAKRSSLLRNTSIAPADQRYVTSLSARWGHEQTPVTCVKFSPERSAATNASSGDVTSLRMKSASLRRGISVSASGASRDAVANRFKSKSSVFGWWPKLSYLLSSWNTSQNTFTFDSAATVTRVGSVLIF